MNNTLICQYDIEKQTSSGTVGPRQVIVPQKINNFRLSSHSTKMRVINHTSMFCNSFFDKTRVFACVNENRFKNRMFVLIYERPNFTAVDYL